MDDIFYLIFYGKSFKKIGCETRDVKTLTCKIFVHVPRFMELVFTLKFFIVGMPYILIHAMRTHRMHDMVGAILCVYIYPLIFQKLLIG